MTNSPLRPTKLCILAFVLSTILPTIVFLVLVYLYSVGAVGFPVFPYFLIVFGVVFVPIQWIVLSKTNEYASQLEQDINATPTLSYQLVNGIFYGLLSALIIMTTIGLIGISRIK